MARIKQVVSESQVVHLWANQVQEHARTSRNNIFFNGDIIYSYGHHFPMARHVTNSKGEKAVLFTERTYSVTTAGHLRSVLYAVNHLNVIHVPFVEDDRPEDYAAKYFEKWVEDIKRIQPKLAAARKPEIYLNQISAITDRIKKYADFFDVKIPKHVLNLFNLTSSPEAIQAIKEIEAKKVAAHKKQAAKALKMWLAGETLSLRIRDGYDYLRLADSSVQTSQGVVLSIPEAKGIYHQLKEGKLKQGDKIQHYSVSKVDKSVVKVGCHTFKTAYLLSFGSKL